MIDIRDEYRKNRESMNAKDAWSVAKYAARREFEQKLRGFEFGFDGHLSRGNGHNYVVTLDGETYEVIAEYDQDSNLFESGEVEVLDKRPYSGQYAREQVMEVGNRRDTQWLVLSDGPKERMKWYARKGDSRQVAYEKGAASCVKSLEYYKKIYEEGSDSYYVRIDKGDETIEACGGIEYDYIEEYVWEQLS